MGQGLVLAEIPLNDLRLLCFQGIEAKLDHLETALIDLPAMAAERRKFLCRPALHGEEIECSWAQYFRKPNLEQTREQ